MKAILLTTLLIGIVYFIAYCVVGRSVSNFSPIARFFVVPRAIEWSFQYRRCSRHLSGVWRTDDGKILKIRATPDQQCEIESNAFPEWNYSGLWSIPGDSPVVEIPQAQVQLTDIIGLHVSFD